MKNVATSYRRENIDLREIDSSSYIYKNINSIKCPNTYLITKKVGRLDMISQEIYGDTCYDWILGLINGLTSDQCIRGIRLKYPDLSVLKTYLNNAST